MAKRRRSTARLIILDAEGSVLLVRYAGQRVGRLHRYWAAPGGACEPGESHRQAAARELAEETRLLALVGRELWAQVVTIELPQGWVEQEEVFFLVRIAERAPRVLNRSAEAILEHRWWRQADLAGTDEVICPAGLAAALGALSRA